MLLCRKRKAIKRATRAREFNAWLNGCKSQRSAIHAIVNSAVFVVLLCLIYSNLVFTVRFDRCVAHACACSSFWPL